MSTVRDIINSAMGIVGVLAMDEAPTASEYNVCLNALNAMLSQWSARRLIIRSSTIESFSLVALTASYTIGASCAFNTAKPISIDYGYIRDSSSVDNPLTLIAMQQYEMLEDKAITSGLPTHFAYDPGAAQQAAQRGTIYLYPMPDKVYTLYIASQKSLAGFTAITDTVTFDEVYSEAIIYNLAVRIWRYFHKVGDMIPSDIGHLAETSLRAVEVINSITPIVSMDLPGQSAGTGYNILSDSFS